jgi:hypothetical protein
MIFVDKKSQDIETGELNTIRNDRDHSNSRVERKKSGNKREPRNIGVDHIVDSYEIYGEDKPDDESEDEYMPSKKRNGSNQRTSAGRRNNSRPHHERIDVQEEILEPSNMIKKGNASRSASNNMKGRRETSQHRESSGVKKNIIEVLDHETPIEEY